MTFYETLHYHAYVPHIATKYEHYAVTNNLAIFIRTYMTIIRGRQKASVEHHSSPVSSRHHKTSSSLMKIAQYTCTGSANIINKAAM